MIALYIAGGLAGLIVVMALIGLLLPRDHLNARSAVLARPPADVWRAITAVEDQVGWRRGLKRVEPLPPVDGKASYRERTSQGDFVLVVDVDQAPSLRITRIDDRGMAFGGRWIYELAPTDDGGTRLAITEDGFVKNPVFRFLWKTVIPQAATLEKFLVDLGTHLGVAATPEPAPPSQHAD
jgi:hypothetical protein